MEKDSLKHAKKIKHLMAIASFGGYGFDTLETGNYSSQWYRTIHALTDLDITVINRADNQTKNVLLPSGQILYGYFSSITVNSGTGIAYLAQERM